LEITIKSKKILIGFYRRNATSPDHVETETQDDMGDIIDMLKITMSYLKTSYDGR
jgi:hypothetical protein